MCEDLPFYKELFVNRQVFACRFYDDGQAFFLAVFRAAFFGADFFAAAFFAVFFLAASLLITRPAAAIPATTAAPFAALAFFDGFFESLLATFFATFFTAFAVLRFMCSPGERVNG